ncbi:hypothetical protein COCON_G00235940 [Conger conger]|uniref:Uncharacterized protein n=1 Tax=Conger conger TaxID=82655 RepID=A0A9Q1CUR3_CONCO|nr:hypothetical protein COCON_G00235940 [Conger conger]
MYLCFLSISGAEGTPNEDAVNYTAVHFKKRKETEDCRAAVCAAEALPTEEDSVIYSGLALTTRT